MANRLMIGVDGGGTKTRIRVMDEQGRIIGDAAAGKGNITTDPALAWRSVGDALSLVMPLDEVREHEVYALLGMAGTESSEALRAFMDMKPDYLSGARVVSDAHIACAGAHNGADGAVVVVGTGICALQIEGGEAVRAGGWGFPQSDEGSGAWMGMEVARAVFQAHDGVRPMGRMASDVLSRHPDGAEGLLMSLAGADASRFGALAPLAVEHAAGGDEAALDIMRRAAGHVTNLVRALLAGQKAKEPLPLVIMGGLSEAVAPYLGDGVRGRLVPRAGDAVAGALLLLALDLGL